jgi:hypothetical protein
LTRSRHSRFVVDYLLTGTLRNELAATRIQIEGEPLDLILMAANGLSDDAGR